MADLYETLDVEKAASPGEIKKAYRRKAKDCHPDTHPGDTQAAEKFGALVRAHDILSDTRRRENYDRTGDEDDGTDPIEDQARALFFQICMELLVEREADDIPAAIERMKQAVAAEREQRHDEVDRKRGELGRRRAKIERAGKRVLKAPELDLLAALFDQQLQVCDEDERKLRAEEAEIERDAQVNARVFEIFEGYRFARSGREAQGYQGTLLAALGFLNSGASTAGGFSRV